MNLLVGKFLRPKTPNPEKLEVYECGEPTIGSSFVQFDIRFYVVALLFIIFDVEVAFFFPWATVFGKANALDGSEHAGGAARRPRPAEPKRADSRGGRHVSTSCACQPPARPSTTECDPTTGRAIGAAGD